MLRGAAIASALLALAKLGLGLVSGSLVVLASAADSFSDALVSAFNGWGYARARTPADADHPYGHGKLEGVLAVGQGMLLLGIVVALATSCVVGLVGGHPVPRLDVATPALLLSALVAAGIARAVSQASRREGSVVLAAEVAHYRIDVLAAAGAASGLGLAHVTGWGWLDPAASLGMTLLMARECARVLRQGAAEVLDEALGPDDLARVEGVLRASAGLVLEFHGLRTRRSGPLRFVEVHALMRGDLPLREAHAAAQEIGRRIKEALPGSRVLVLPDAAGMSDSVDDGLDDAGAGPGG